MANIPYSINAAKGGSAASGASGLLALRTAGGLVGKAFNNGKSRNKATGGSKADLDAAVRSAAISGYTAEIKGNQDRLTAAEAAGHTRANASHHVDLIERMSGMTNISSGNASTGQATFRAPKKDKAAKATAAT